ncbi:MAG: CRISPR-associated endonuclease Cas6 [Prolixibacteraceae bacterium]
MQITQTIIRFPEISLATRDAHKLRGYFGKLFREHSPLLHNHFEDGRLRYAYPLVQYKVIGNVPVLVGFAEGAGLLTQLFLKIKEIKIGAETFPVYSKNISQKNHELSVNKGLYNYAFKTLWMGLNQKNFKIYLDLAENEQKKFLDKTVQNNILSFYKGVGFRVQEQILVNGNYTEKQTLFKDKKMIAFTGRFSGNAVLPGYAGIGKAVSRGFGTVQQTG